MKPEYPEIKGAALKRTAVRALTAIRLRFEPHKSVQSRQRSCHDSCHFLTAIDPTKIGFTPHTKLVDSERPTALFPFCEQPHGNRIGTYEQDNPWSATRERARLPLSVRLNSLPEPARLGLFR